MRSIIARRSTAIRANGCIGRIGLADGLVAADREEVVDGRLRRYYRLTGDGAVQLAAEVDRLRKRAEAAATRLAIRPRLDGAAPS